MPSVADVKGLLQVTEVELHGTGKNEKFPSTVILPAAIPGSQQIWQRS